MLIMQNPDLHPTDETILNYKLQIRISLILKTRFKFMDLNNSVART